MKEATSKEKVLKKVRNALINKSKDSFADVDFVSPVYVISDEPAEITFAQNFTALTGKFAFCEDTREFTEILKELIQANNYGEMFCLDQSIKDILSSGDIKFSDDTANLASYKTGITLCEFLITRTGSIMVSSKQTSGRRLPVAPDVHIVLAFTSQLVEDIKDALKGVREKYEGKMPSMVSLITGPSRTADIEKTLIIGAHGPKEIYVFLIDDNHGNT